jgi:Ca-activated chloride channel family protein
MFDWLHWKWFLPQTLGAFSWENPLYLYTLLLLPLFYAVRWLLHFSNRQKLEIALTEAEAKDDAWAWLRHIPSAMMTLLATMLIIALARPQETNEQVEQFSEGIDIMLAMDISESMQLQDFQPNRLMAAKEVARNFVKGRFQDRIGIVVFSGDAYSLAPLTTDYELLKSYINEINFDMIQNRGTAIGSALAVATNRLRDSETKSKVIILLSDGESNAGNIDPIAAAKLAFAYGVKIYTIGVGQQGKVPFGTDMFGRPRYVDNSMDETTLREIAKIGEGQYFRATDNATLQAIFDRINNYEKAEIKENRFRDTKDFYQIYLIWGIVFFLIWLALRGSFITNALED